MRTIFIILLIINVAYFAGRQLHSSNQHPTLPAQLHPEKIVLVPAQENCLIWGNFYEEQIQYAAKVLSDSFPGINYSLEESSGTLMHWLYIPPFPNKEAANREINKLRNLGVVSFRVKDDNQWENAVSLGIFYDRNDALKQLREIEKKGITSAKIEDRSVVLKKIVIHEPVQAIKDQMQNLVEQFEDTQLQHSTCER